MCKKMGKYLFIFLIIGLYLCLNVASAVVNSNVNTISYTDDGGGGASACSHKWVVSSTKLATCTVKGSKTYKCSKCGATKTENIIASHKYKLISSKNGSCMLKGSRTYKCTVCGDTKLELTNALGHNYVASQTKENLKSGNCEVGLTYYKVCSRCGKKGTATTYVPPTKTGGHKFPSKATYTPKNETKHVATYECTKCGFKKLSSPTKHNFVIDSKQMIKKCKQCGYSVKVKKSEVVKNFSVVIFGGDGDDYTKFWKNIMGAVFPDCKDILFLGNVRDDYTKNTATSKMKTGLDELKDKTLNVVIGYSHGGQNVQYIPDEDYSKIDKLVLVEALVNVDGKMNKDGVQGGQWSQKLIDAAKQNTDILICVAYKNSDHPATGANWSAYDYLKQHYKEIDDSIVCKKTSDGYEFSIKGNDGNIYKIQIVELNNKSTHGSARADSQDAINNFINGK